MVRLTLGSDGTLSVFSTDGAIDLILYAKPVVDQPGEVNVPADRINTVVKACSGDEVSFAMKGETLVVKSGKSRFRVQSSRDELLRDRSQMAMQREGKENLQVVLDAKRLREMLGQAVICADTGSKNNTLQGVLVESGEGKLHCVGTDGRKLVFVHEEADGDDLAEVMPTESVRHVIALLAESSGQCTVSTDRRRMFVKTNLGCAATPVLSGRYPPWRKLVERRPAIQYEFDERQPFSEALSRASILCDKEHRWVEISYSAGEMVLKSEKEANAVEDAVAVEANGDESLVFACDGTYVNKALAKLPADAPIRIDVPNDWKPVLIESEPNNWGFVIAKMEVIEEARPA